MSRRPLLKWTCTITDYNAEINRQSCQFKPLENSTIVVFYSLPVSWFRIIHSAKKETHKGILGILIHVF
jgi:hypothetical protein